jgi:hypothetical protein
MSSAVMSDEHSRALNALIDAVGDRNAWRHRATVSEDRIDRAIRYLSSSAACELAPDARDALLVILTGA